jgi:hypothetical protein
MKVIEIGVQVKLFNVVDIKGENLMSEKILNEGKKGKHMYKCSRKESRRE